MLTIEKIKEKHAEYWIKQAEKRNNQLQHGTQSNRASGMGACARKIYYTRAEPEQSLPWYNPGLLQIFRDGDMHEADLEKEFEGMGYQIRKQQKVIDNHPDLKAVNITGHSDWTIIDESGDEMLAECKSMNQYNWTNVHTWQDFNSSYYMKNYPIQGQLYMFGLHKKEMVFITKNKEGSPEDIAIGGNKHFIPMELNKKIVDCLIEKAEIINFCVNKKQPPKRQEWCDECTHCPFLQHCLPDIKLDGINIEIEEPEASVVDMLDEMETLKEAHSQYEKLNKLKKAYFKSRIGDRDELKLIFSCYEIKIKQSFRDAYMVAAGKQVRTTIKKLEVNDEN